MDRSNKSNEKSALKEQIEPVADLFLHIEKTLRAHRTYDVGHVTIAEFEKKLHEKFTELLKDRSELVIGVKPYEYLYENQPVYSNKDKRDNFSFQFHQDGIRQFHFEADGSSGVLQWRTEFCQQESN